jgi:hypothetical protein
MRIVTGSIVKTISTNGLVEGGKLLEFTDDQLVLELFDGSISVTLNPRQNIVKIVIASEKVLQSFEKQVYIDPIKNENIPNIIEEKIELPSLIDSEYNFTTSELRVKSLAELHKLKAEEERKLFNDSLKSNQLIPCPEVTFGTPDFSKPLSQYPKKKIR